MDKSGTTKKFTTVIPLITLVVGILLVVAQLVRISLTSTRIAASEREYSATIAKASIPEIKGKVVVDLATNPDEQSEFLKSVLQIATSVDVQVTKQTSVPPRIPVNPETSNVPPDVKPLATFFEVTGKYQNVREFLYRLLSSDRLMNVMDVGWKPMDESLGRSKDMGKVTALTFTLTRYVRNSGAAPIEGPKDAGFGPNVLENISK